MILEVNRHDGTSRELPNGARPKRLRHLVRRHHPDFPVPGKTPPHRLSDIRADAALPIPAGNKELGHVPDARLRLFHQYEARQSTIHSHEERVAVRLTPIAFQLRISKP